MANIQGLMQTFSERLAVHVANEPNITERHRLRLGGATLLCELDEKVENQKQSNTKAKE